MTKLQIIIMEEKGEDKNIFRKKKKGQEKKKHEMKTLTRGNVEGWRQ